VSRTGVRPINRLRKERRIIRKTSRNESRIDCIVLLHGKSNRTGRNTDQFRVGVSRNGLDFQLLQLQSVRALLRTNKETDKGINQNYILPVKMVGKGTLRKAKTKDRTRTLQPLL
jgi:hypothetical protein